MFCKSGSSLLQTRAGQWPDAAQRWEHTKYDSIALEFKEGNVGSGSVHRDSVL